MLLRLTHPVVLGPDGLVKFWFLLGGRPRLPVEWRGGRDYVGRSGGRWGRQLLLVIVEIGDGLERRIVVVVVGHGGGGKNGNVGFMYIGAGRIILRRS